MTRHSMAILALAAAFGATSIYGCAGRTAAAQTNKGAVRGTVDITVYNEDFAMVREDRPVSLAVGKNRLHIADVSKMLDPSSVLFSWQKPGDAQVVADTYDLGVGTGGALLSRYLGQEVEVVWYGQDGREGKKASGTLEVAGDGGMVVQSDGKYIVNPSATVIAPSRPDIVTIPQLSVDVESKAKQDTKLNVAYLTRGLSWSADYVATLDPVADDMYLECWATVTNKTGTTFPEAKITLVAGAPNRAAVTFTMGQDYKVPATLAHATRERDADGFAQGAMAYNQVSTPQAAGELYAYTVKSAATVAPDQMNRVRMLYSEKVPAKRDYSIRLPGGYYDYNYESNYRNTGSPYRQNAQLAINFIDNEKSGLGAPLPKGAVRVYEPNKAGATTYVGAADIRDTPKEGRVNLTLSNVFDVTSEYRVVSTKKLGKKHTRTEYQAVLRNAKSTSVNLRLVQIIYGKVSAESTKGVQLNPQTRQWTVPIPSGGQTKLTFSVDR